jgi:hypothetical protein
LPVLNEQGIFTQQKTNKTDKVEKLAILKITFIWLKKKKFLEHYKEDIDIVINIGALLKYLFV